MQPTRRHVPPSSGSFSTQTTFAPSCAARIAAVYPPGPPPRTATSQSIALPLVAHVRAMLAAPARTADSLRRVNLEGVHHVTAITGDAPRNVEFYAGALGLRLVKKTVNQDDPTVYHLFYADEQGSPGADLTFFEYPGAARGRAGDGQVHRIVWRVAAPEALDFWAARLAEHGVEAQRVDDRLRFSDPEGLEHELKVSDVSDAPLIADHPEVPREHALQGFDGVRAYASDPARSE